MKNHDSPEGRASIKKINSDFKGIPILTDKACEGNKTKLFAEKCGFKPVVPPKATV